MAATSLPPSCYLSSDKDVFSAVPAQSQLTWTLTKTGLAAILDYLEICHSSIEPFLITGLPGVPLVNTGPVRLCGHLNRKLYIVDKIDSLVKLAPRDCMCMYTIPKFYGKIDTGVRQSLL